MGINPAALGLGGGAGGQTAGIPGLQQAALGGGTGGNILGNAMGTGNPGAFQGINLGIGQGTGDVFQSSTNAVNIAQTLANGGNLDPSAMASLPGISPSVARSLQETNSLVSNGINGGDMNATLSKLPASMRQWAAGLMQSNAARKQQKEAEAAQKKEEKEAKKKEKDDDTEEA